MPLSFLTAASADIEVRRAANLEAPQTEAAKGPVYVGGGADWETLSHDDQRALIGARLDFRVKRVGRGKTGAPDRVVITGR